MKVLFQGDSVTDAGRDRSNPHDMGEGYPRYAAAMIQDSYPDTSFEFINLGISGNRTADLVVRLRRDFIDIQPDIVSLLIGINDVWHRVLHGVVTTDEAFERNLRTVLEGIHRETPAKILLIQPFLLRGGEENGFREELCRKQAICRRLADEYADAYLEMEARFGEQDKETLALYSRDGIHPTQDGAAFIGEAYLRAVMPLVEQLIRRDA